MRNKTYIIAEIGINHEGDVGVCEQMITAAAESGVDAVKLQTINADANYVIGSESYNIFKGSELTQEETARMFDLASKCNLDIFTTAGDIETISWVNQLNPSHWKISSGLLTHIPIVGHLASLGKPMLVSTGMASIDDIDLAIEAIKLNQKELKSDDFEIQINNSSINIFAKYNMEDNMFILELNIPKEYP